MMDTLLISIMNALDTESYISSQDISSRVGKSDKTVRLRIRDLNDILVPNGAHIITKKGQGFRLKINDFDVFKLFEKDLKRQDETQSFSVIRELIHYLMESDSYHKADDLSDSLYVSKSTLTKYLNELRVFLRQYDLEILVTPHYGMKVEGNEFNKRRFIASNFAQTYTHEHSDYLENESIDNSEYASLFHEVSYIVRRHVNCYQITMSDAVLQSVIAHIAIAIIRIRNQSFIELNTQLSVLDKNDEHTQMVREIMDEITNKLSVNFPEQEIAYISMHFLSKQVMGRDQSDQIPREINELIDTILLRILDERKVELSNDLDLRTMLGLHLLPLIYRLKFGTYLKNPILGDVKLACIAGYDLAIIASEVITEYVGKQLHDHEISYLAMHFDVSLNRSRDEIYRKNILVVCSTGRASGQLLKHKFSNHFSQYIKRIDVCDIHEIEKYESDLHYDYIFTTVPLMKKTIAPVFEFEFFLNQESVHAIETILTRKIGAMHVMDVFQESLFFVNQVHTEKEVILNEFITKIIEVKKLPEKFRELVLIRENFSSTDVLPRIAIPHPNQLVSDESFVACMVLDKPVVWGNHEVSILFLPCLSRKDSEKYGFIYDWIIKLSESDEMMLHVQNSKTYESLVESLLKLTNDKERVS